MRKVYLASKSPRRLALLQEAGYRVEAVSVSVEEILPEGLAVTDAAEYLARLKSDHPHLIQLREPVISSDTTVILDGEILHKPKDTADAKQMLQRLSGQLHEVKTGICIRLGKQMVSEADSCLVQFNPIPNAAIDYYIEHYQPFDKAGGYGIQEWLGMHYIPKIEGSYFTVMGLPVHRIESLLDELNLK
ncbi:MAG: Maf family protein [Cyclobacteriaceae bacterium]|nr:septum formation protein Maf [Cyclobacteriaceae bacterium]MCH8517055.1 Maf family protein [Cyclobacteriaceae bacterium]